MSDMDRRSVVGILAVAPAAAALKWTPRQVDRAARAAAAVPADGSYAPQFFNPREWETVRMLVNMIIPADERSGSGTDAGVPEFMDFIMTDRPSAQPAMRGGLAWLDDRCLKRFGKRFVEGTPEERGSLLDAIAYPRKAAPEMGHGVAFFNRFRDLTATGFFTTKMGMADVGYRGNTAVVEWQGCPQAALDHLNVRYR